MIDVSNDIKFKTARSGGNGGQNVNKVESMVEGYFHVYDSVLLNDEQKALISEKLGNRITKTGHLLVKSQEDRSQLGNKEIVVKKINSLISNALKVPKKRKLSKPSRFAKEKRMDAKKINGLRKENRMKIKIS